MHIVEAEGVRLIRTDWSCLGIAVVTDIGSGDRIALALRLTTIKRNVEEIRVLAYPFRRRIKSPKLKAVSVPARALYSHSASDRSRYSLPVIDESHATYFCASSHEAFMTGRRPRPKLESETAGHPPRATHSSHSSKVTAYFPAAKALAILTSCWGPSLLPRPSSLGAGVPALGLPSSPITGVSPSGEPMTKVPAGMTTISGQCSLHSRNVSPPLSAFSFSGGSR